MQTLALPPGPTEGFDLGGSDESLARLRRYFKEYGDLYRVFAPARGVYNYVINHPDDIKRVLLSNHRNYTKGEGMDRVKILLGNGIMTSEGDFWRRQRRMMQPSFHRRVIDQFSLLIRDVNDKFAAYKPTRRRAASDQHERRCQRTLPEIVLCSIFAAILRGSSTVRAIRSRSSPGTEPRSEIRVSIPLADKLVAELINRRQTEEHLIS